MTYVDPMITNHANQVAREEVAPRASQVSQLAGGFASMISAAFPEMQQRLQNWRLMMLRISGKKGVMMVG